MEGSVHFQERLKTERRLPEAEEINWGELATILREAEVATERLQSAHEGYIEACQAEKGRHPTAEQMTASDAAWTAEQQAYDVYTAACERRNQAMQKLDLYMMQVHKAYKMATDEEMLLLEKRHRLEAEVMQPDGTVSFEHLQAIETINAQLPDLQAKADAAYQRLQEVLEAYSGVMSPIDEEAMAAK